MTLAIITNPPTEPLTLAEIKMHLRLDHAHEDALLTDILRAARQYCEFASGQKLITQVWRQYENCLPADRRIVLRVSPVQAVEAVTVFDGEGSPLVLNAMDYDIDRSCDPVVLDFTDFKRPQNAANGLEIDLRTGFGDLGIDVPDTLRRAMLMLIAHWYEFRGAVSPEQQPVSLPAGFETLMLPFRRVRL